MTIIYYCEINLVCIIILLLFTNQMRYKSDHFSVDNRILRMMLWTTVLMCISDMVAGICRGQLFRGARALIEISNLLFYESISVVSFLWLVYVFKKYKIIKNNVKVLFIWSIPLILISIVTLTNPFTNFLFTIDDNNLYIRNIGVYFHWIESWFYLIVTTGIIIYKIIREQNKKKRKKMIPPLYFIIAPVVAAVIQMLFYGITCAQVGITISIVIISLTGQNDQILTDALTGLSNRYGFDKYCENYMQYHSDATLFLMMIDINNFKYVNDKFGHLEGDKALVDVADAVKQSCEEVDAKLFVCRYGGDELLIAGFGCSHDEIRNLKEQIQENLEAKNRSEKYPYLLSVSMGTASGRCLNLDDVDCLLRVSDKAMYEEKRLLKNQGIKVVSRG